jgi:hypothetical protein
MKIKQLMLVFALCISLLNYGQTTITTNTTWSGQLFLSQKVIVNPGVTLTISPSTTVSIGYVDVNGDQIGDVELVINGKLNILGGEGCSIVKFSPFNSTTNKSFWTGITLNSSIVNDSITGIEIYNANKAFNVLSTAKLNSIKINDFGEFGIYFQGQQNETLDVNNAQLKNGGTGVYVDNSIGNSKFNWLLVDACSNGLLNLNSNVELKNNLISNSKRLGIANKEGNINISNSKITKNYCFGVFNSSGNLTIKNSNIDTNYLGGILIAGIGNNNINQSNIRNNKGSQIEITDFKFDLNTYGSFPCIADGNPTITVNNNNILGDTLSTFSDTLGLFNLYSYGSGCWENASFAWGNCPGASNNCTTAASGASSPLIFKTVLGRLEKVWIAHMAEAASNINQRCFNLRLRDENSTADLGGTGGCAPAGQNLNYCVNSPASGTFGVIPTYEQDKYIFVNATGSAYTRYYIGSSVNKAFYKFGGDLIFNNIRPNPFNQAPIFNFQNNNFGQPILTNYFFDQTNQSIDYLGYTIFNIASAGLNNQNNLYNTQNFPIANLITSSGNDTACIATSFTLIAPEYQNATYQWYLNGNLISTTTTNQFSPTNSGEWYCKITTSNCNLNTNNKNIVIVNSPVANISSNGSTSFCQGGSIILNANSGTGLTYQWQNNGVNIPNATTSSYTATTSGVYIVIVSNSNNCSNTSNGTTVTVNSNVTPTFIQISPVCSGSTIASLPTTSINNITGSWSPALNNTTTTTYTFTPTLGQCALTNTVSIQVNALPIISMQPTDNNINIGNQAFFSINSNASIFQWQINSGVGYQNLSDVGQYSGTSTSVLTISNVQNSNNNEQFRCIVNNSNCSDTSNFATLTVINNIGIVNYTSDNDLYIYPNPSNSILNLDYGNYASLNNYRVKITNALSQIIYDQAITQQTETLDLSTFGGNGIYYLSIINPQGNVVEVRKIVLQ